MSFYALDTLRPGNISEGSDSLVFLPSFRTTAPPAGCDARGQHGGNTKGGAPPEADQDLALFSPL